MTHNLHLTPRTRGVAMKERSTNMCGATEANTQSVEIGGWNVSATTCAMATSTELEALSSSLYGLKPPSMVFLRSHLTLSNGSFTLSFNARDALALVGELDASIKVRAASAWAAHAARAGVELSEPPDTHDWTYTTSYAGTSCGAVETTANMGMDMEALRDASLPIRFFASVPLFDDELDDNGAASYRVRVVRMNANRTRRAIHSPIV